MKKLEDLRSKWLATQILDHEEHKKTIKEIFQRIEAAMKTFNVCTIPTSDYICLHLSSQVEIAISIQNTASQIHDDVKVIVNHSWTATHANRWGRKLLWNDWLPLRRQITKLSLRNRQ